MGAYPINASQPASPGVKCGFGLPCRPAKSLLSVRARRHVCVCVFVLSEQPLLDNFGGVFRYLQRSVGGQRSQVEEALQKGAESEENWCAFVCTAK